MKLPWFLLRAYLRLSRGMTLGARVAVFDANGQVLLVNQSYGVKWILPGGGVDRGETLEQAARRELREEAAIIADGTMHLHGIFSNDAHFRGDHLAIFVAREYQQLPFAPTAEIRSIRFFPPDDLPAELDEGSRRRIMEIVSGAKPGPLW